MGSETRTRRRLLLLAGLLAGAGAVLAAHAPQVVVSPPVPTSPVKAKELAALLQTRKLETFAAPETTSKFVAVFHVPGVQLLVASAAYGRPLDFDYRLLHKEYMEMYMELKSSPMAADKFFVEDQLADGLVVQPVKNGPADAVTVGAERLSFDGDFADPRRRNQKKISQEDYYKAFSSGDARYAALLDVLLKALKTGAPLAHAGAVR